MPAQISDEEKCRIVQINHEVLFEFDENTTRREELSLKMIAIAENFFDYLKGVSENPLM